jgi:hypothetical protein
MHCQGLTCNCPICGNDKPYGEQVNIQEETLSDGSKVYNVLIRNHTGLITLQATSKREAVALVRILLESTVGIYCSH